MPYDEKLAGRVQALVPAEPGWTQKRMFGGLSFLLGGNMVLAVSGKGGLMVRINPDADLPPTDPAQVHPMVMRDKVMTGWLRVEAPAVAEDKALQQWFDHAATYVRTLPVK